MCGLIKRWNLNVIYVSPDDVLENSEYLLSRGDFIRQTTGGLKEKK